MGEQRNERSGINGRSRRRRGRVLPVVLGVLKGLIALGILGGGVYAAYWFNATEGTVEASPQQTEEASRLVETVLAERGDPRVRVRAMGTVMAAREAVIRPRVEGMIVEQSGSFVPGGFFEEGAFMVQLDRSDYEQAIVQRESDVASAEAALRIEEGDQAVAREELDLLEIDIPEINRDLILRIPQVKRAEASVQSAKAALRAAELDLERTRITAPFDGHVVTRSSGVGNNVSAGEQLATFVGSDRYWIELAVPVSSLRWIEIPPEPSGTGSPARVVYRRGWGGGVSREGHVTQLVGRLEQQSRLARVIVSVDDPRALGESNSGKPELLLDAFVEVTIEGRRLPDGFVIDRDLIREDDTVWIMGGDDRLDIRDVSIAFRGKEHAYVTDGLQDGERVVTTNLQMPVAGMLLREAEPAQRAPRGIAARDASDADG